MKKLRSRQGKRDDAADADEDDDDAAYQRNT